MIKNMNIMFGLSTQCHYNSDFHDVITCVHPGHTDRWGSDAVPLRMKTRGHIQPLNTDHQVAAGFVPPWKQELLEKKRKRESLPPPQVDRVSNKHCQQVNSLPVKMPATIAQVRPSVRLSVCLSVHFYWSNITK